MKRIFILVVVVVISFGSAFAERNVLIDFSNLVADLWVDPDLPESGENKQTLMDYSGTTQGSRFTAEQTAQLRTSLVMKNWLVTLASSSQSVVNNSRSYVKRADSTGFFGGEGNPTPIMGVRVHFPVEPYNSWASIKPPFTIPAYEFSVVDDDGTVTPPDSQTQSFTDESRFENGYGILKNVGAIKQVSIQVYGLNYPHHLSVIYEDDHGVQKTVPMGYLNFDGWRRLTWDNPAYIQEVRARTMRLYPLYPVNSHYIKFVGLILQRDAANAGGDFIVYFKDIEVIYDKAIQDVEPDIDDETTWRIRYDREEEKSERDSRNFGLDQVLRYIEGQKQATETFPTTAGSEAQGVAN
ncbi:MAG: flagellar filament outer layer protein FlaA [Spirochaetaceae bacterium]|jgi:hypothetical protein|nr:flagellar filament outer layer protein FlaA [Spirochaetaceae bacterium]